MRIRQALIDATKNGAFTINSAREVLSTDWREDVAQLSKDVKIEAEDLFYFVEGYVEEFDEGFVTETNDPELYERAKALIARL